MALLPLLQALAGGILIGFGVAILLLFNGRVTSTSTMMGAFLRGNLARSGPRMAFLGCVILAPIVCEVAGIASLGVDLAVSGTVIVISGLLVGFGARLGDGTCSGHAICGVSRFSFRSTVAVLVFGVTAVVTVFVMRHLLMVAA